MDAVSSTNYDGYRWVKYGGGSDIHCRYIEEAEYTQYTPADDADGLWVKTIYADGRIEWSERQPSPQ